MEPALGIALHLQSSLPNHGVDWRFLLPIDDVNMKVLVIHNTPSEYEYSLNKLGIHAEYLSFGQLTDSQIPHENFDIVIAPLGICGADSRVGQNDLVKYGKTVYRLIRSGGMFLIGFSNLLDPRQKKRTATSMSVWGMRRALRKVGFHSSQFYGALPEPFAPEYIFPLRAHLLSFVLHQRYQHKLPKLFFMLARTSVALLLLNFLPFYYVVARVK